MTDRTVEIRHWPVCTEDHCYRFAVATVAAYTGGRATVRVDEVVDNNAYADAYCLEHVGAKVELAIESDWRRRGMEMPTPDDALKPDDFVPPRLPRNYE